MIATAWSCIQCLVSQVCVEAIGVSDFFFLMIRRPPRSTQGVSSAASDVYKRQEYMGENKGMKKKRKYRKEREGAKRKQKGKKRREKGIEKGRKNAKKVVKSRWKRGRKNERKGRMSRKKNQQAAC
eukprot:TRINITY_DN33831_c0_g1_i1.p3 TRINITY_DN33831_c0_g1~~TRINITY_DN33831_c0_g1_i1.p3  ORF type:complete len:126 (-),score=31.96 TRINITY_DN33831_c0_g1_i1:298-675(-)